MERKRVKKRKKKKNKRIKNLKKREEEKGDRELVGNVRARASR